MSAEPKLPRWTEPGSDAPSELAQLLRAGRAPLGSAQEVAQLSQGLGKLLGPAAGLSGTSLAAPAASAGLGLLRWAAWAAAGVSSVGALWYFTADTAEPPLRPAVVESQPAPAPAPPAPAVPTPVEPEPVRSEPVLKEPVLKEPAPPAQRVRPAARRAGASETELLRRAQATLVTQPARTLALTTEHQRRFRDGALAEEREALAIEALRRLGRTQAADQRASLFLRRYPNSVHTSRVRGAAHGGR
jgi:hypothetical protein